VGLVIVIGLFLLWWVVLSLVKERYAEAKARSDERIMDAYLRAEDARAHRNNLAAIRAIERKAEEDMLRIVAEASGEIIEGTAVEVKHS
jgi:hypothetical protein